MAGEATITVPYLLDGTHRFQESQRNLRENTNAAHCRWEYYLMYHVHGARLATVQHLFLFLTGSTSSGKSTLVNALLGESVLPTNYNAATAVLCEIKYWDRKHAVVHLEDGRKPIHCDLSTADGCKTFESYVSPAVRDSDAMTCRRVELFWPVDFLKVYNLI